MSEEVTDSPVLVVIPGDTDSSTYVLLKPLGEGAFSIAFAANSNNLSETVALKVRKPVSAKSGSENLILSGSPLQTANAIPDEFHKELEAMKLVKDKSFIIKLIESSATPATFVVPQTLLPSTPSSPNNAMLQSNSTAGSAVSALISSKFSSTSSAGSSAELERSVSFQERLFCKRETFFCCWRTCFGDGACIRRRVV
jgi:serine/threonine protein kinase